MATKLSDQRLKLLAELDQRSEDLGQLNLSLRKAGKDVEDITWVLQQLELRRKAEAKLGNRADSLLFTRNGLEQASRWSVARYHAQRLAGLESVADLGCGLGVDSLAFAEAGLRVVAVEQDPETVELTQRNLLGKAKAICESAEQHEITTRAVYLDPARRDLAGRYDSRKLLTPDDFSPSLTFSFELLQRYPGGIKLAPGLPHELIPMGVEATWVSHNRDLVELGLWSVDAGRMDKRYAVMLGADRKVEFTGPVVPGEVGEMSRFVYEPDPALIRSGLLGAFAKEHGLKLIASEIAYLTSNEIVDSPWLRRFEVLEQLPLDRKLLREKMVERGIGRLEIKKRGVDIDPAALRKELKLKGEGAATLILTRVGDARKALVCTDC